MKMIIVCCVLLAAAAVMAFRIRQEKKTEAVLLNRITALEMIPRAGDVIVKTPYTFINGVNFGGGLSVCDKPVAIVFSRFGEYSGSRRGDENIQITKDGRAHYFPAIRTNEMTIAGNLFLE